MTSVTVGRSSKSLRCLHSLICTLLFNLYIHFPSNLPPIVSSCPQILLEAIPTWNIITQSNLSFIFLPPIFPYLPHCRLSDGGNSCSDSRLWFGSGPVSLCPLTLHIYADGLDGSHPHPVVSLAVVAAPLHPLDGLDPQRLVVDGCFLELVGCAACCLCPSYLDRKKVGEKPLHWQLHYNVCVSNLNQICNCFFFVMKKICGL